MNPGQPLHRFLVVCTTKIGEMEEALGRIFSKPSIEINGQAEKFQASLYNCQLQHIGLTYEKCTAARLNFPAANFFSQIFPIRGGGEIVVADTTVSVTPERGVVASPGMAIRSNFSVDYELLGMRIDPRALTKKLMAISGVPVVKALRMEPGQDFARPQARSLRNLLLFIVGEIDATDACLHRTVLAEWEQALMVAFLCGNRHNYSPLLEREPSAIAPWQVRRVEEYIEANWDRPIRMEDVAAVAGTSARSIFRAFRHSRGYSPMTFAKQIRLRQAQRLLKSADPTIAVKDVAFACGFGSLGRFSKDYYRAFGELPSDALKRV